MCRGAIEEGDELDYFLCAMRECSRCCGIIPTALLAQMALLTCFYCLSFEHGVSKDGYDGKKGELSLHFKAWWIG